LEKQRIAILGSTGSIGTQALDIIRQHPNKFDVILLTANSNVELLIQQTKEFKPVHSVICNESKFEELKSAAPNNTRTHSGMYVINELVQFDEIDIVLNSLVGFAGFQPTFNALNSGKRVALANKESLVVGGRLITSLVNKTSAELIPVDSEHSAMLQCIVGEPKNRIEKIIITASGGPFRDFSLEQMDSITVEQALKHPNWDMGAKITIDSSTMMNKGLEIIEAHWLFDLPVDKIEPVIHPQSIIHSIVTYVDGSSKAQLGPPDMKVPIIYALSYPDRLPLKTPRMDWSIAHNLTFYPVDYAKFPCVKLAMEVIDDEDLAPAILNAANEVAVQRFLNKEIGYISIPKIVEKSLEKLTDSTEISLQNLINIDKETREYASRIN
jgi:1-deoxy-D-xylulose-5-phosphate reductoisomerase